MKATNQKTRETIPSIITETKHQRFHNKDTGAGQQCKKQLCVFIYLFIFILNLQVRGTVLVTSSFKCYHYTLRLHTRTGTYLKGVLKTYYYNNDDNESVLVLSPLEFVLKVFVIPIAAKLIKYEQCLGTKSDSEKLSKVYKYAHRFAAPQKQIHVWLFGVFLHY